VGDVISEHGIVLRIHPCREADLIVSLLTRSRGKISALARNAKSSKKRFLGGIDYFDCGTFQLKDKRRGSIAYSLEEISSREPWPGLRQNMTNLSCASFCLEVVNELTVEEDEEGSRLFRPLFLTLRTINKAAGNTRTGREEILSLCVYLGLQALLLSGFDAASTKDEEDLSDNLRLWFDEVILKNQAILPHDSALLQAGIKFIGDYTEKIIGKSLKSKISGVLP
jgi:recombinational DNA repair protein (RecF pathway)